MARRKYGKPGTRHRPQAGGGTAKGAVQFAVNPKGAVLKEVRKRLKVSTGGTIEMPQAQPN